MYKSHSFAYGFDSMPCTVLHRGHMTRPYPILRQYYLGNLRYSARRHAEGRITDTQYLRASLRALTAIVQVLDPLFWTWLT